MVDLFYHQNKYFFGFVFSRLITTTSRVELVVLNERFYLQVELGVSFV